MEAKKKEAIMACETFDDLQNYCREEARKRGYLAEMFQSNSEGAIIDKIQEVHILGFSGTIDDDIKVIAVLRLHGEHVLKGLHGGLRQVQGVRLGKLATAGNDNTGKRDNACQYHC